MVFQNSTENLFRFQDQRQERIYRRLSLISPGSAVFYRDACRLMALEPPLTTTTHMVSHAFREVDSALRQAIEPLKAEPESDRQSGNSSPNSGLREDILKILAGLEIDQRSQVAQAWLRFAEGDNPDALHTQAHRDSLARPRPVTNEFRQFVLRFETILDVVLERLETQYLKIHEFLDGLLLKEVPSKNDIKKLRNNVPNNIVALGYFFRNLQSPKWLEPLHKNGFFKIVPDPHPEVESGNIRFPPWPVSSYLLSMAATEPDLVTQIAIEVPATENIRVHETLTDIALALPSDQAAKLVPVICRGLHTPYRFPVPDKLSLLAIRLAQAGKVERSFTIARPLFAPLPPLQPRDTESHVPLPVKLRTHFYDISLYSTHLNSVMSTLLDIDGLQTLIFLSTLLERALSLSQGEENRPLSNSLRWYASFAEPQNRRFYELESVLVATILEAANTILMNDKSTLPTVIQTLEKHQWFIFRRLSLHLLHKYSANSMRLAAAKALDFEAAEQRELRFDHSLLLRDIYPHLLQEQKDVIFTWINAGPDIQKYYDERKHYSDDPPGDNEISEYVGKWRRDRLALLRESLPDEWSQILKDLEESFGRPTQLTPPAIGPATVEWSGYSSPLSLDDLTSLSETDLFTYLRNWHPSNLPGNGSQEGLAEALKALIAAKPSQFAAKAAEFLELDPVYVNAVFQGLYAALENGKSFDWGPVFKLSQWVLRQPAVMDFPDTQFQVERWSSTRRFMASLLSKGLESNCAGEIDLGFRTEVWSLLSILVTDTDPTPTYENLSSDAMDPSTIAINTVRAMAMHAVVFYCLWVRRHCITSSHEFDVAAGLDLVPEARTVLEFHLEPKNDPSLAVRSVYGRWLPSLASIDLHWTTQNKMKILPREEPVLHLRQAAWDAYLAFNWPTDALFGLIQEEYAYAVATIDTTQSREVGWGIDPVERLGKHLSILYWQGHLNKYDQTQLIDRFFENSTPSVRQRCLEFVGRSLAQSDEDVPAEIIERLQMLWEGYLEKVHQRENTNEPATELSAFGTWFTSGKFESDWCLLQLKQVLDLGVQVEPTQSTVRQLVELSPVNPARSTDCLALIFNNDIEGWGIHSWRESAHTILSNALRSSSEDAVRAATDLINRIASRGHLEFRDLLKPKQ